MLFLARFLSVRYWMHHRGAFLLSALGVALGLAVFVAIQIANYSVLAAFSASFDAVAGKANLQISAGAGGLPDDLPARILRRGDTRVKALAPSISKTLYSPTLKTSILLLGVDLFSEADVRGLESNEATASGSRGAQQAPTRSGGFTELLLDPQAIAVSRALANRSGLRLGSEIEVYSGANRRMFRVARILDEATWQRAFGGDFALLDIAAAQENFGLLGKISQIDLVVDEAQIDALMTELERLAPRDAIVARPAQRGAQVADLLRAFQLNLAALSCISLFVGAFLVYNAIAIAVVRRRSEVGLLRATGAARSQITRLFLLEAAVIGFVGSIAGYFLGVLLARAALGAVAQTVSSLYLAVKAREIMVPLWLMWAAPLGGVSLAVVSALPAALEAGAVSPRAALSRAALHHTATRWALPVAGAGLFSLLIAFILCRPEIAGRSVFAGFASTFFTLGGWALMTPLLTLWGGKLAQRLTRRGGVESGLASSYLQRALARSSLVVAALMVSLAMTIGMAAMVGSFRGSVVQWVNSTISADLYIAPATGFAGDLGPGLPPEVVQFARAVPRLGALDSIRSTRAQIGNQPVQIAANELPALLTGDRKLAFKSTVLGARNAVEQFAQGKAILVSERFESLVGIGSGKSVELPTPSGARRFFITGVFYDYTPNECLIYVPQKVYQRLWRDSAIDGVALYFQNPAEMEGVITQLQRQFGPRFQLTLLRNSDLRNSVFDTFDQTFAVTYALQLVAILVAAIGIFDTLVALLLERSRELATLRAVGASGGQIVKTTLLEFALVGFFAWLIGAAAGLCLAWQLIFVINKQFFGWTILWDVPLVLLLQSLGLSLVASVGAGLLPALSAARRPIAPNLQTE
ncbi:MAG TPA: FtsX-like permease family protein [Abditibacteriaceae bacterium]